jgi:hypothetical protein
MRDCVHGLQQAGDAFAFGHVPPRSGGLGDVYHACAFMHGEKKNTHAGKTLMNFPRGAETVKHRHRNIQNHQVRSELEGPG